MNLSLCKESLLAAPAVQYYCFHRYVGLVTLALQLCFSPWIGLVVKTQGQLLPWGREGGDCGVVVLESRSS